MDLTKLTELPLEEEENCRRCDGEGFEYHRKTKEKSICSLCFGACKVTVPTYLGQQILDFIDKHRGGAA